MAIADIAASRPTPHKKGPDCTVCKAIAELPEADAAGLVAMLSDPCRRFSEIADLVAADEDTPEEFRLITTATYRRHAKGGCAARVKLR